MASLNKQQKRAKRAKIKAKQQRIPHTPKPLFDSFEDAEFFKSMQAFDTFEDDRGWTLFDEYDRENDISQEDLEAIAGIDEDKLQEIMLEQFHRMKEAESISRVAMFTEFFRGPTGIIALSVDDDEPMPSDLISMLVAYEIWAHGTDPDVAADKLLDPGYGEDYNLARETVTRETEALIDDPDFWDIDDSDDLSEPGDVRNTSAHGIMSAEVCKATWYVASQPASASAGDTPDYESSLDPEDQRDLIDTVLDQFENMKGNERVSQSTMFFFFLKGPLGIYAYVDADKKGGLSPETIGSIFMNYKTWAHGTDDQTAYSELRELSFSEDFRIAMEIAAMNPDVGDDDPE